MRSSKLFFIGEEDYPGETEILGRGRERIERWILVTFALIEQS